MMLSKMPGTKILLLLPVLFALAAGYSAAREVSIEASITPARTTVGEPVRLSIVVTGAEPGLRPPKLPEMDNFSSYFQGHSEEVAFESGQTTSRSVFSYILVPSAPGKHRVDQVQVTIQGVPYKAPPLEIFVDIAQGPSGTAPPPQPQAQVVPPASHALPAEYKAGQEIFVKAWTDRQSAYVNQPFYLTYTIYTRVPTTFKGGFEKEPATTGFWVEEFPPQGQVSQHERNIGGYRYIIADVRSMALFPTQPGTFTFDPGTLKAEVEIRKGDPFDPFFSRDVFGRRRFQRQPMQMTTEVQSRLLQTEPIILEVKPLPAGAPADFKGAVGSYSLEASLDRRQAEVGQPVKFKLSLSGEGNLNTVELPKLSPVEYFKYYDSSNSLNLRKDRFIVEGEKIQETVLVPKRGGQYSIPSLNFSFFDPRKERYVTLSTKPLMLSATGGAVEEEEPPPPQPAASLEPSQKVEILEEDVRFIMAESGTSSAVTRPLVLSRSYWVINIALVLAALILLGMKLIWERLHQDVRGVRLRRSHRLARKHLRAARSYMRTGAEKEFYQALSRSVYGYFADKMNVEPGIVGANMLEERLKGRCPPSELVRVRDLFHEIDYGRFAASSITLSNMKQSFKNARRIIDQFERKRL